jgi:ATP-binding cassette subfamily B (MDR/TAP) protein 1
LINELNVQEYRKHLALVSQEPTLYSGTVRFNILLGAIKPEEEVAQEEIEDACRKANILEFIEGLPQYVDHRFIYFIFSQTSLALQGL